MTKIGRSIYEEGMEKGIEKGMEKGIMAKARQAAEKLLRRGSDMETVVDITGLTEEEIKEIEEGMSKLSVTE